MRYYVIAIMFGIFAITAYVYASFSDPLLPTGDGYPLELTTSTSSANHYTLVDETECNGNQDYVYSTSPTKTDNYQISMASLPDEITIEAVHIIPCASAYQSTGTTSTMSAYYVFNGVTSTIHSYTLSGTAPVELATTSWTGLSLQKDLYSTLSVGLGHRSGTRGMKVSKVKTVLEFSF